MVSVRTLSQSSLCWIANSSVIAVGAWITSGLLNADSPSSEPIPQAVSATPAAYVLPAKTSLSSAIGHGTSDPEPAHNSHSSTWNAANREPVYFSLRQKRKRTSSIPKLDWVGELEAEHFIQSLVGGARSAGSEIGQSGSAAASMDSNASQGAGGFAGTDFGSNQRLDTDGDGYQDFIDTDPLDPNLWRDHDRDGENDSVLELPEITSTAESPVIHSGGIISTNLVQAGWAPRSSGNSSSDASVGTSTTNNPNNID